MTQLITVQLEKEIMPSIPASFDQIAVQNQDLSNKFSFFMLNQAILSAFLVQNGHKIEDPYFQQYNAIRLSVQRILLEYCEKLVIQKQWTEINTASFLCDKVTYILEENLSKGHSLGTFEDQENLESTFHNEFPELLKGSCGIKVKNLIFHLMPVLSFLFLIYRFNQLQTEEADQHIIEEFIHHKENFNNARDPNTGQCSKFRRAQRNTLLHFSSKTKSKKVGAVRKNQKVFVIEIEHKWLFICFINCATSKPKSGYVLKKYFKALK